jgi:CxxC motif-containing protein (DUF1111 family)
MWARERSCMFPFGLRRRQLAWLAACVALSTAVAVARAGVLEDELAKRVVEQGRELFTREWLPGDPAGHKGDGLGPMYNDTSCVACHNQGGAGGAGSSSKNVDLVTAVVTPVEDEAIIQDEKFSKRLRELKSKLAALRGEPTTKPRAKGEPPDRGSLIELHAGFRGSSSLMLHRFGSEPQYESRRIKILSPRFGSVSQFDVALGDTGDVRAIRSGAQRDSRSTPAEHGHFTLIHTQRNPTPLFGVGLIDAVPDVVLKASAWRSDPRFPEIKGRVCQLADGRVGRFGWKAEQASLEDFVLTACAVELGLEVPGRHQGVKPEDPDYRAPGLDLSKLECDALVAYVRKLPTPSENQPTTAYEALAIRLGQAQFGRIGCAACHRPQLGRITGIYSDLLLHDTGDSLSSDGAYASQSPSPADDPRSQADARFPSGPDAFVGGPPTATPASRREWRTPPLWGVRDSGPYLHDGRAETLEQAIALHGGEALQTRNRYFRLEPRERICVQTFLKSLVAPELANAGPAPRSRGPILTSTISR